MQIDFPHKFIKNETVAVALSGGSDSMALLYYMLDNAEKYQIKIIAINVEHGIRGKASENDTEFVKGICKKKNVPLLCYSVDSIKKATEDKLTLEQAARTLRYDCFYDALNSGKCDKVATAHHSRDNLESILFNLFRGTGIKGICGIDYALDGKIIRPFLNVSKEDIETYIKENSIPFVTDETNFSDDYTRNYIRLNLLPEIKKIFPYAEKSAARFSEIAKSENDYMEAQAKSAVLLEDESVAVLLSVHPAIFKRAAVIAMKYCGIEKDWEKTHLDQVFALCEKENGKTINLPKGVVAVKEYDRIAFYRVRTNTTAETAFKTGKVPFGDFLLSIDEATPPIDLKSGLYLDFFKIPASAVIRTRKNGDRFTKFGGGTKSLSDFFTDKKIPLRLRDFIPVVADGSEILAVFGVEISEKVKTDENSKKILKLTYEENYGKL